MWASDNQVVSRGRKCPWGFHVPESVSSLAGKVLYLISLSGLNALIHVLHSACQLDTLRSDHRLACIYRVTWRFGSLQESLLPKSRFHTAQQSHSVSGPDCASFSLPTDSFPSIQTESKVFMASTMPVFSTLSPDAPCVPHPDTLNHLLSQSLLSFKD